MKSQSIAVFAVLAFAATHSAPAHAHHGNVAFEVNKIVTITGVVKDFQWRNPHTWLFMTVDDGKGGKVDWTIEGRPPGILLRSGWTKTSIKPGETITVDFSPAKDGSKAGLMARVTKADGTILANAPPPE